MEYVSAISDWNPAPQSTSSGLPVSDEQYIKNVRDNCLLDLPNLDVCKDHDRIMVMVCGGPSAKDYLDEISMKSLNDRYSIVCSNKTHDWLIENGIIPDYQFIIDPKPEKVDDIKTPHEKVKYLLGISCDNAVYKALEGYDVTRVFSVCGTGEPSDVEVIKALFPYREVTYLFGGTMAGLRAMSLADIMGYMTLEFYGFDSCYFEEDETGAPIYYSYDKKRAENILEAKADDGRTFMTSPVFASQAQQFIKWKHRLEWIKFVIHGDSLTSHINALDDETHRPKHDLMITDYQKGMNSDLHAKADREALKDPREYGLFGSSGHCHAGNVAVLAGQLISKFGPITMLDYGCGKRTLEKVFPPVTGLTLNNYDPCIEGLDLRPEPADIVVCTDVLEHIEPECLENVLDDLERVTKKACYISIATRPAKKTYSDGQNCHLIVEDHEWWRPKLKKRFYIGETQGTNSNFTCVMQARNPR
jgi:uncharacterized Rossmann fold enzyme